MPLYDYECLKCGNRQEVRAEMNAEPPEHCSEVMIRLFTGSVAIRDSRSLTGKRYALWHDRIDDPQKAQEARGERVTALPHPSLINI